MRHDEFVAEFERLYAEIARRARPIRFEPNTDVWVSEDGATIVVAVEIAGAEPDELRIGIEEEHLYIVGHRSDRERPRGGSMLMKEIEYGDFAKKIHLPFVIDQRRATAAYRDGMLTVRLPVAERTHLPLGGADIRMIVRRIPA